MNRDIYIVYFIEFHAKLQEVSSTQHTKQVSNNNRVHGGSQIGWPIGTTQRTSQIDQIGPFEFSRALLE
jgi:hypothetical protein